MIHGPVASGVKDIAERCDFLSKEEIDYATEFIELFNQYDLKSLLPIDDEVLSESEIEALNFIWTTLGHYDEFALRDITHEYPEWRNYEKTLFHNDSNVVCLCLQP